MTEGLLALNLIISIVGGGLIALGIALFVATILLWRGATHDPEVLAPLEVMADRSFAKSSDVDRMELLNRVRPDGAELVDMSVRQSALFREPLSEPVRPWNDPFAHDDDAVDVVEVQTVAKAPPIIDPLLRQKREEG